MANAADRKSIRAQEKLSDREAAERGEVLCKIASSPSGRAWLWEKLSSAHIFVSSFRPDVSAMAFAEGERNQGLILLNDILAWCPEQFVQMMVEHNVRRTARQSDSEPSTDTQSVPDGADGERSEPEESGRDNQGPSSAKANGGWNNLIDYGAETKRAEASRTKGD